MTMSTLAVIDIVGKDNYWIIAITDLLKSSKMAPINLSQAMLKLCSKCEGTLILVATM